jgi:hypothetical protein
MGVIDGQGHITPVWTLEHSLPCQLYAAGLTESVRVQKGRVVLYHPLCTDSVVLI